MSKKIIRVIIVAEQEIDTNWYDGLTDEDIKNTEGEMWPEWAPNHVKSEKIELLDGK